MKRGTLARQSGMDQVDVSHELGRVHDCGLGTQINYIGCPLTCDNSIGMLKYLLETKIYSIL